MMPNPFLGVALHGLGGLAAGSFYLPLKRIAGWSWESYWLVCGVFSWIAAPWVVASLTVPGLWSILVDAPAKSLFWSYAFGVLWGIGGLTFGLSMRYLGMSLGYALALGFCAALGTIIPPVFRGEFPQLLRSAPGLRTLVGVVVCLAGIAVCGWAGVRRERELSPGDTTAIIREANFARGVWVAILAGVMSACMAFAIAAGKPIAELAVARGVPPLWQNSPVFIVVLAGGFTTNCIWCIALNIRNRSMGDYVNVARSFLLANYLLASAGGITWYLQFMFYGMGTTQLGRYDFSSWTIHMAFIIVFSNLWGLLLKEWRGTGITTHRLVALGIATLIASTIVVGAGNMLARYRP